MNAEESSVRTAFCRRRVEDIRSEKSVLPRWAEQETNWSSNADTDSIFSSTKMCTWAEKREKTFLGNPISTWIKIGVSTFVKLCVRSERLAEASVQIYLSESFLHPPSFLFNFTLKRSPASENAFQLNNWWILITSQRGLDSLPSQPKVICCGNFSSFFRLLNPLKLLIDFPMNPLAFTVRVTPVEVNQSVEWETFSLASTWEVNSFFLDSISHDARRSSLTRKSSPRREKLSPRIELRKSFSGKWERAEMRETNPN